MADTSETVALPLGALRIIDRLRGPGHGLNGWPKPPCASPVNRPVTIRKTLSGWHDLGLVLRASLKLVLNPSLL
jgi:hypothetical protein